MKILAKPISPEIMPGILNLLKNFFSADPAKDLLLDWPRNDQIRHENDENSLDLLGEKTSKLVVLEFSREMMKREFEMKRNSVISRKQILVAFHFSHFHSLKTQIKKISAILWES